MAELVVFDAFNEEIDRVGVEPGRSFAQTAVETFPDGFPDCTVFAVAPDGTLIEPKDADKIIVQDGDQFNLVLRPQGPETVIGTFLATQFLGSSVGFWLLNAALLVGSFLLMPKMPNLGEQYQWTDDSPQFFSGQDNRLRPGSRVPDVFGTVRVYPDMLADPVIEYFGSEQRVRELYVVSNGNCTITDARISDQDIADITNSRVTVYPPGSLFPGQGEFPIYSRNEYVGQVALPGPNNADNKPVFSLIGNTISTSADDFFTGFVKEVGRFFAIGGSELDPTNNKIYRVTSVAPTEITVTPSFTTDQNGLRDLVFRGCGGVARDPNDNSLPATFTETFEQYYTTTPELGIRPAGVAGTSGARTPPTITAGTFFEGGSGREFNGYYGPADGYTTNTSQPFIGDQFISTDTTIIGTRTFNFVEFVDSGGYNPSAPGQFGATDIFNIPRDINQIKFDIEFPSGLYEQTAGQPPKRREVTVRLYYRLKSTAPDGAWTEVDFTMSDTTRTPRRFTHRHILGAENVGEYQVYFQRITDEIAEDGSFVAVDACQLIGLYGRLFRQDEIKQDVQECTLVLLELRSGDVGQIASRRRFSVIASRQLPDLSIDGNVNRAPPNSIEQAVLYTLMEQGGHPAEQVDRQALKEIQQDLNAIGDSSGLFNGIIDQTLSAEDQASLIANVGRIGMFRRGSFISFWRLKQDMIPTKLINSRNKIEPEARTMNFADQNEATSIIIRFMDANEDFRENSVQWPDPGNEPGANINPETQSVIGVTSPVVAERIARHLWDRNKYEKDAITLTLTDDGILLSPGEVIAVTDHLEADPPLDGEVLNIVGTNWTFDQTIPPGEYVVRVTNGNGDIYEQIDSYIVATGSATHDLGFGEPIITPAARTTVGLRYSFTPVDYNNFELFYVRSVSPSRDGPVSVQASAYRQRVYRADVANIPFDQVSYAQKQETRYGN